MCMKFVQCMKPVPGGGAGKNTGNMSPTLVILVVLCAISTAQTSCSPDSNCDTCGFPGMYGANCALPCPVHCESGCHRTGGYCDYQCQAGYYGRFCNQSCSSHCREGCNQTTAKCFGGCVPGWYGDRCTQTCLSGCGVCDRTTGRCLDKPTRCATEDCSRCEIGWYGLNCSQTCPRNCDEGCDINGICDHQCVQGYYGNTCSIPCPTHCIRGCNQTTGYCFESCEPGYYGDKCTERCPTYCIHRVCYRHSGRCTKTDFRTTTIDTSSGTKRLESNVLQHMAMLFPLFLLSGLNSFL